MQAVLAAAVFLVALFGLLRGVAWISAWFYDLSWWSYIFFADALVHLRRGESLILSRPRAFLGLAIASAAFWLFFEAVNFRIENWYYVGIPRDLFTRGPGVWLSFATVLPGIFETYELLSAWGFARNARCTPWRIGPRVRRGLTALGVAFLILPLAFPRACYPLIWGATVLLVEPWLAARNKRGLLSTLAAGDPRPVLRIAAAGAVCGLLWESLNWRAHAKWIYTVPLFEEGKLFEMPFAGFLGFPPFALECYSFARLLVALRCLPEWELDAASPPARPAREIAHAVLALAFAVPVILGINRWTLRATLPEVDELPGVTAAAVAELRRAGIDTTFEFLAAERAGALPEELVRSNDGDVARWIASAEMMHVQKLGARGARWLEAAGIATVAELARAEPEALHARLSRLEPNVAPRPVPRLAEVRVWVLGARDETGAR